MSGDSLSTFGPSDSGFLNSFLPSNSSPPLQSRVGEDEPRSPNREPHSVTDPLEGSDSVLTPEASDATAETALTDSQIDLALLQTPLPEGFLSRLHQSFDEGRFDSRIGEQPPGAN